jgi:hypothetical protein
MICDHFGETGIIMRADEIDDRDRAILRSLMSDRRLTSLALAERVQLSSSACLRRVRLLEERGLIAGYVMLLDPDIAGLSGAAFVPWRSSNKDARRSTDWSATSAVTPKSSSVTSWRAPRTICCASRFATRATAAPDADMVGVRKL